MYVHISPRKNFFRNSIFTDLFAQFLMGLLFYNTIGWFRAVLLSCNTVWVYYDRIGEKNEALSHKVCIYNIAYYGAWFFVNLILIILRLFSLTYMVKSFRYLYKREIEKTKKR